MAWKSPEDAMPWVGLYVSVASLVCTLLMAADVFQGFRQWKLWFPCRYFTINAASITLIAIAMKLPVDLTTNMSSDLDWMVKSISLIFLVTMLGNFLPSLGLMDDKELLTNIVALGILIITISVNVGIQRSTSWLSETAFIGFLVPFLIFPLLWPFSVALTVPKSRRILGHQYKELQRLDLTPQEIRFSHKKLIHYVKRYWVMTKTGNPQFAIACSPVSSAFGVTCAPLVSVSVYYLFNLFAYVSPVWNWNEKSDYKWSIRLIVIVQLIGIIVGSIAPIFRCLTSISYFNLSKKWSKNNLNVFRVEKHWIERLQQWKRHHVRSHIPGRHCKKIFHNVKNMILNIFIVLQISVVFVCKIICIIPRSLLILVSFCWYLWKSLLKRFKDEPNVSSNDMRSEMQEYTHYVLQIEEEAKVSKRILRNNLKSITRLIHEFEEKEPSNLIKLLTKSVGFNGVVEFDNDRIPPLHADETQNCWSLVAVTLTAIAIAFPNIAKVQVKGLLASMREGLQIVRHIEESLNANGDLIESRKASARLWTQVEVYHRWLQIDLQKNARKGKTSKKILQWLGDEAIKIVIDYKRCKNGSLDHSLHKFISASCMYRISQTILLNCNEQENWPANEELFELISTIIADIFFACFSNLPCVITMKCHHNAIEKREEGVRTAAQLLGKSKKIMKILKQRQLPMLDVDSMAYIDKWSALLKSQMPNDGCASTRIYPASSSSNDSFIVTIT